MKTTGLRKILWMTGSIYRRAWLRAFNGVKLKNINRKYNNNVVITDPLLGSVTCWIITRHHRSMLMPPSRIIGEIASIKILCATANYFFHLQGLEILLSNSLVSISCSVS